MVSYTEGVSVVGRFCYSNRLSLILGRFAKCAKLGEAYDQAVAIKNRCRRAASELVIDPVRGQRREAALGQLNRLLVLSKTAMHISKTGGGQDPKIQVAQDSCGCKCPGPTHPGVIELAE